MEIKRKAKQAIYAKVKEGYTVSEIARQLGLNSSAHISNVTSQRREPGPTLVEAIIEHGWIPKPPPYPYFKIRRDNTEAAAAQIMQTLGRTYVLALIGDLRTELGKMDREECPPQGKGQQVPRDG